MSDTASFVDPVFLARFGLSRINAVDYFLHPLNPFRTKATTSNEVLGMQNIGIGLLIAYGTGVRTGPMTPEAAEEEYNNALTRLTGEQYELLPPPPGTDPSSQPSPLYTIRHVLRSNPSTVKVLGIYYILEGVIYKSPAVRSLMKANVTRTMDGLSDACDALSVCARYLPSTGYTWDFSAKSRTLKRLPAPDDVEDEKEEGATADSEETKSKDARKTRKRLEYDPDDVADVTARRKRKRRILDNRRAGERTAEEEEGIRASEAIDRILLRLTRSRIVVSGKTSKEALAATENATKDEPIIGKSVGTSTTSMTTFGTSPKAGSAAS